MKPRAGRSLVLLAAAGLVALAPAAPAAREGPASQGPARAGLAAPAPAPPAGLAAPAPRGTRYVYLIRHGAYDRADTLDDRVANGLSPLGHEQARLLAARLHALPVRVRLLVSSDFTRARETADDIGGLLGLKAERDTLLEECTPSSTRPGTGLGADRAELALCEAKLRAAWDKYVRPSPDADAHDLLVCHGNVIRWFVIRALGGDERRWISMDIGNASLTILAVRADGTTRLVMYSDVGHLPLEKQTWLGSGAGWGRPGR